MVHLNMEQLQKCLASLYNMYDANRNSCTMFENEAEYRSLYVLLHLDSGSQPMVGIYIIDLVNLEHVLIA